MPSCTELTIYKDAEDPIHGSTSGTAWAFPGAARSANTCQWYGALMKGGQLLYARWLVEWNPSTGVSPTGIRLCAYDSDYANEVEIARFLVANVTTPRCDAINITATLQAYLDAAASKTLGHQTVGTGQSGCLIYGSLIELVWA